MDNLYIITYQIISRVGQQGYCPSENDGPLPKIIKSDNDSITYEKSCARDLVKFVLLSEDNVTINGKVIIYLYDQDVYIDTAFYGLLLIVNYGVPRLNQELLDEAREAVDNQFLAIDDEYEVVIKSAVLSAQPRHAKEQPESVTICYDISIIDEKTLRPPLVNEDNTGGEEYLRAKDRYEINAEDR